jgi:hypothetical protein
MHSTRTLNQNHSNDDRRDDDQSCFADGRRADRRSDPAPIDINHDSESDR